MFKKVFTVALIAFAASAWADDGGIAVVDVLGVAPAAKLPATLDIYQSRAL